MATKSITKAVLVTALFLKIKGGLQPPLWIRQCTQNDLFHNSVKSCLLQQLQSVLLKFRNSHKSHFQHTSTAIHVSSTNDLAGLIVGVGLQHGEIQCLETG